MTSVWMTLLMSEPHFCHQRPSFGFAATGSDNTSEWQRDIARQRLTKPPAGRPMLGFERFPVDLDRFRYDPAYDHEFGRKPETIQGMPRIATAMRTMSVVRESGGGSGCAFSDDGGLIM